MTSAPPGRRRYTEQGPPVHSLPVRRELLTEAAIFLFFVVAAVAMTWPLAVNLASAVPDHGDAYWAAMVMRWDAHALVTDAALFDLPIFHPARQALAFSEHLVGIVLPVLPLYLAGAEPLVAYNVALLFGFVISGYGAYVLARVATGARAGAIVGGLFFAFLPYRFTHLAQIQYVTAGWLALLLAAWLHWTHKPTRGRAVLFGIAFFVNGLACLHWLVLGALAVAFAAPAALASHAHLRNFRAWVPLAVATVIAGLALAPLLLPYVEVRRTQGMERSFDDTLRYSARPSDWLVPSFHVAYGSLVNDGSTDPERWLFPGLVPLLIIVLAASRSKRAIAPAALAIVLLTLAYFRAAAVVPLRLDLVSSAWDFSGSARWPFVVGAICAVAALFLRAHRRVGGATLFAAGTWIVVGFVLSLGPSNAVFRFLFQVISPLRGIRVPTRWAMIAFLGLAILIAFAVGRRAVVAAFCAVLLLLEQAAPNRFVHAPSKPSLTTRWLKTARFEGGVLDLPQRTDGSEYRYLREAATHLRPIIGGVSSFEPKDADPERHAGIVVVHRAGIAPSPRFTRIRRFCREEVFALKAIPFAESCDTPDLDVVAPQPNADVRGPLRIEIRTNGKAVKARLGSGRVIVPLARRGDTWSAILPQRPRSIERDTDLQIEIDGHRFEGTFLTWRRALELRWYDWRSPATWEIAQRLGAPNQLGRELLNSHAPANVLVRATLRAGQGLDEAGFRDFAVAALIGRRVDLRIEATDRAQIVFAILGSDAFARANLKM